MNRNRHLVAQLALALLLLCGSGAATFAAVADASSQGFTVRIERTLEAPPAEAWRILVEEIGAWWHPDHTFSGDAANLSIDARAQGCFCERLEPQGEVRHLTVTYAAPGKRLRMAGGLGPLQEYAVAGSLTFELAASEAGTRLELTYAVGGYLDGGLEGWAPIVDGVLSEQMDRLTAYVATGRPAD